MIRLFNTPHLPAETRVVVAMSGGVDSSVAAALIKEAGYDVIGVTLQLYDSGAKPKRAGSCCAGQDIYDAKLVAQKFHFPHYVLDYESRFKEEVIDDFAESYLKGETPIPCIRCNQTVKFRDLLKTAKDLEAQALVTGHYIQRIERENAVHMHQALDESKDQSYFLFATTQEQLEYLRFPLGGFSKHETRQHAKRLGLKVADKPDSQDICFVQGAHYASIIEKLKPGSLQPGDIVHLDGRVLGSHDGIIHYTVGQRRGLNIGGTKEPLYVIYLDRDKNHVIVGPHEALQCPKIFIKYSNWLGDTIPETGQEAEAKYRSNQTKVPVRIFPSQDHSLLIEFLTPQFGISPGQACVLYEGTRVLGGGWIHQKLPK